MPKMITRVKETDTVHAHEDRPWGSFDVLFHSPTHQVKHIIVMPSHRLSLQFHNHREEHWVIISGLGLATIDSAEREVKPGDYVHVCAKTTHRIKCISNEPLVIVEVWTGDYLGEDDIIRLQDDYARMSS